MDTWPYPRWLARRRARERRAALLRSLVQAALWALAAAALVVKLRGG